MSKLSLKQFVNKEAEQRPGDQSKTLPTKRKEEASLEISSTILAASMSLTKNQANEFSSKVMEVATSDNVIDELSEKVGTPLESETEDQFVQRASAVLKNILMSKLSSKKK